MVRAAKGEPFAGEGRIENIITAFSATITFLFSLMALFLLRVVRVSTFVLWPRRR